MPNRPGLYGLILIFASSLLAACGGGGGGSAPAETPATEDHATDTPSVVFDSDYVQKFNSYLPLTDNSAIYYKDATLGFEIPDATEIDYVKSEGEIDIYTLSIPAGEDSLTLHISSTPDQILLYKIDGPIEAEGFTVNTINFQNPITVYPAVSESTQASANVSGVTVPVAVTYSSSNSSLVFDEDYGRLPTLQINLETTVSASAFSISETFTTTLELAKGIGVVRNQGTYANTVISYNINRLTNLPQTIWFENVSGVPILASGSDDQFRINGVTIKPSLFELLNENEINELGWINVAADTASDSYIVTMESSATLPAELTSVEVVFERKSDKLRMSGNVTLQ